MPLEDLLEAADRVRAMLGFASARHPPLLLALRRSAKDRRGPAGGPGDREERLVARTAGPPPRPAPTPAPSPSSPTSGAPAAAP